MRAENECVSSHKLNAEVPSYKKKTHFPVLTEKIFIQLYYLFNKTSSSKHNIVPVTLRGKTNTQSLPNSNHLNSNIIWRCPKIVQFRTNIIANNVIIYYMLYIMHSSLFQFVNITLMQNARILWSVIANSVLTIPHIQTRQCICVLFLVHHLQTSMFLLVVILNIFMQDLQDCPIRIRFAIPPPKYIQIPNHLTTNLLLIQTLLLVTLNGVITYYSQMHGGTILSIYGYITNFVPFLYLAY